LYKEVNDGFIFLRGLSLRHTAVEAVWKCRAACPASIAGKRCSCLANLMLIKRQAGHSAIKKSNYLHFSASRFDFHTASVKNLSRNSLRQSVCWWNRKY